MQERLQYRTTLALAKRAMEFIADYRTPPTPHVYELFYTVAAGLNPGLNEAVARVIAEKCGLDAADVEQLYNAYLARDETSGKIEEIGRKLNAEVAAALRTLGTAAASTRDYEVTLDDAERKLKTGGEPEDKDAVLHTLIATTKQMAETNSRLTANLEASQAQVRELEQCLRLVREETSRDALTGTVNRKRFDLLLNDAILEAGESGQPLSLILADIDHFKAFNDRFGHLAGDAALKYIASCLKSCIKGRDAVSRYGGEEFAILLPDTELDGATALAENIRKAVSARELVKKSSGRSLGTLTVSFGVATLQPGECAESLMNRADMCLYAAKQAGRDRVSREPAAEPGAATNAA